MSHACGRRRTMPSSTLAGICIIFACLALPPWVSASSLPYQPLDFFEKALRTTATDDFDGNAKVFEAAAKWNEDRLRASHSSSTSTSTSSQAIRAPHLACTEDDRGREIFSRLQKVLSSAEAVRPVSSGDHGACFLLTASCAQADAILAEHDQFGLNSLAPFPSAIKLAPGLLEHRQDSRSDRLSASHGTLLRMGNVEGLSVELSPGTLPAQFPADSFIENMLQDLTSESLDLRELNFWSSAALIEGENLAIPRGAVRRRNWTMVATLVHDLAKSNNTSPDDICSWSSVSVDHAADDLLLVQGLDHLLYLERGTGVHEEEAADLHVACFMGLVSFLASRHEVLRVAPTRSARTLDAAVRAIIQTAAPTQTPLTDAGLDGTGEVIQILDSGLDETSCFFVDGDGQEVTHGYYFDELSESHSSLSVPAYTKFKGGDFSFDSGRRKVIQYIDMIKPDSTTTSSSYFTASGHAIPWIPADGFGDDERAGHGTHTAGTAAGATLNSPADTTTCDFGRTLSCAGACIDATGSDDDLVPQSDEVDDIDRQCPLFGCDDDSELCLGEDVGVTLAENGGMAQGAKLAVFDIFDGETSLANYAGNGLWEPCLEAGCRIHSNSWGGDGVCTLSALDILYDDFMYKNPDNLLIFAAGNDGENQFDTVCTIGSPAIAKNVIAVGATSAGESRLNSEGIHDIDHVASLSSWGFTKDSRIKPEVVAPGDMIYSAASDGTDMHTCRLWANHGTSMSTPVVAGASAMVRQYFVDTRFYAADVASRGFCGERFICEGFSPSSATVKALLINSANLMGGGSEPDGNRGFGRIHLEMGMPLDGEGSLALFVADAGNTSIPESSETEYRFDVDADAGLALRATLSWIDPPATTFSGFQLVHDLDLTVISPNGMTHTMWSSGEKDAVNVNERVVVSAEDVENGTWKVLVSSNSLSTAEEQNYSLVVNGAISPGPGGVMGQTLSSASPPTVPNKSWLSVALSAGISIGGMRAIGGASLRHPFS